MNTVDKAATATGIGAGVPSDHRKDQDPVMEAFHWFLLGMMVAWTPGLTVLAAHAAATQYW